MKLSALSTHLSARHLGADVDITGIASLTSAGATDLSFVERPDDLGPALQCSAGALIAGEFAASLSSSKPLLIARQPRLAFARAARLLLPPQRRGDGIHPSAAVHSTAHFGRDVLVHEHAVVAEGARIGDRSTIGPGAFVGPGVVIGEDCILHARVAIYPGARLGNRVVTHAGAVLGSDGFGYVRDESTGAYEQFPQIGRLEIGDDVEIGANTTIDRGALDATVISRGVKLDNLVHIGHNCVIGEDVVIAAQTGISGSTTVERGVIIGGQAGLGDHARIGEGVILGGQSGVLPHKIVRGKGILFWGTPAKPLRQYLRELATVTRIARK